MLRTFSSIFIIVWLLMAAFPFVWTLWGSFKVELDFFSKADWQNALTGARTVAEHGTPFTTDGYQGAWIKEEFWKAVINTSIVCFFVVTISLTIGTLGGYALSRSAYRYTFWLLITALIFRAMPPITLVATLWMLHSFFQKIPKELDESAKVDGCSQFQAFRHVIIPVMWPGVITTGLFSFLLAYNDFAVTSMLLSKSNQTMVPKIASFLGTTSNDRSSQDLHKAR